MKAKLTSLAIMLALSIGSIFVAPEAKAQPQQSEQIAIQLGAIQLGIDLSTANTTQVAQALVQGRAVLNSRSTKPRAGVISINGTSIESLELRNQILEATRLALSNPQSFSFKGVGVTLTDGKTVQVRANLNPQRTTASAILAFATTRIPNFSPDLVGKAINGAFLTSSPNVYVFRYKNQAALFSDINRIASTAMRAGLRAYSRGTRNWAPVPSSGMAMNATYLPNFSRNPIQPKSPTPQAPNLAGLSHAAGAISATAVSALESNLNLLNPADGLLAMSGLAQSLVRGAVRVQRTSTGGPNSLIGGAIAGSGFGQTNILADTSVNEWNSQANAAIMNGIISGALRAAKRSNAYAFAWGVATGFVAAYYEAGGSDDINTFRDTNVPQIAAQFTQNKVPASAKFNNSTVNLNDLLIAAFNAAYAAFTNADYTTIAGAIGLQLPGVPDPVTDTVGL